MPQPGQNVTEFAPAHTVEKIGFLGNYLPRKCGIATFTHDVHTAVAERYPHAACEVCAVTDPGQQYDYPDSVTFEIDEQDPASYLRAADYFNLRGVDSVCIQHEFGIYGGESGRHILDFARAVEAPIVTTLHTVLERPTVQQDYVLRELTALSARVVVMSECARDILVSVYGIPADVIDLIPHGIPDMPFVDSSFYKDKIGIEGKFVLLTFGLLSANKGIEHVIDAMPGILEEYPNVIYLVLGATHPHVLRTDGETYRRSLEERVERLGLQENVQFHNRFVEIEELKEFIAAADMYVTPYLNADQIVSGTLAYSFGCGKAVISTPYLHALELLADDRGIIVPFADPGAISLAALGLLRDESRRHAMRKRAYLMGREMIWSEVAARYMESFEMARRSRPGRLPTHDSRLTASKACAALPPINLQHLRRLTDSTGLIQHARYRIPHTPEGYCTDDNARALSLAVMLEKLSAHDPLHGTAASISNYASFVNGAFNPETRQFRNFMSYDRRWLDDRGSDDCQGRSIRALGVCIALSKEHDLRQWAVGLFQRSVVTILETRSPRAWAHALIGIDLYLRELSGDRVVRRLADELTQRLLTRFADASGVDWPWFEDSLAYDNAVMSHALITRGSEDQASLDIGLMSLGWLMEQQTSSSGHFRPIGSAGFYPRGGERANFDQQPIESEGMVSASLAAYEVSGDRSWLDASRIAFEWFHGRNDLGLALYDPGSGGCRDGLSIDRVNRNQGAESTLAYLSARVQMELASAFKVQPSRAIPGEPAAKVPFTAVVSRRRAPGEAKTIAL
jgi:glycosyltransferase involved in cell wall biosynthesis